MNKIIKLFILISICILPATVKAECPLNFKNLSIASQTNNDKANIIRLQSILYINNLYTGPITGYYGNLTKTAINRFKEINGLKPDGIVDTETTKLICDQYAWCPFQSFLKKGDESPALDIKLLQSFLRLIPSVYPEKLVTGYFGTKTENAVKRLQKSLNISQTGQTDAETQEAFCNFFANLKNSDVPTVTSASTNTTSIFQTLCLAVPSQASTNQNILFISQILGGSSPYKYIWNNDSDNNSKTFQAKFSKTGIYTVNLKVIDNKGLISTSNCKVNITNQSTGDDNIVDWDSFSFDNENNIEETENQVTVKTTSIYDKYLYNKKSWQNGWLCETHPSLSSWCQYITKSKDIENKLIYIWNDGNEYTKNKTTYSLQDYTMIYDTKEECSNFCDAKDGDTNKVAYKQSINSKAGWVCGLTSQKQCSYLESGEVDVSVYNRLTNKNIYISQKSCETACTSSSKYIASTSKTGLSANVTQEEINQLIKNPLQLDCEILPIEIVKNDPVKITIVNMPYWARYNIDNNANLNLRGYWAGDIINQYLDLTKGEYTNQYDIIDKNGKIFDNGGYQNAYGSHYFTVPKNIPPIYCGDNKCDFKESNPKSSLYCRKDCIEKTANTTTLDWSIKPINQISTLIFTTLYRLQPDGSNLSPTSNQYLTKTYGSIFTWLLPKFFNSGIYSIVESLVSTWWRAGTLQQQFMTNSEVWENPYASQLNLNKNFYKYNPGLQNGVLGGRILYWTFDKSGTYNLNYKLYYSQNGKEYLIGQTNNCSINVIDNPSEGKYMRMFLTYDVPTKSKVDCPKNFYLVDPKTKELQYITSTKAQFKNIVGKSSIYPYRDLDGSFISFNWNHLYMKSIADGGSIWNYYKKYSEASPNNFSIPTPVIGDTKYEKQINWGKIDNLDKEDFLYINKTVAQVEKINIDSKYYQPFSCLNDGSYWKDYSNVCKGSDKAIQNIFGYQNNQFISTNNPSATGWRGESSGGPGNIYSGSGIRLGISGFSRTLCIEEPIKDEPTVVNKRNSKYYPDLTLANFKLGNIKYYTQSKKRQVSIEVRNIGGEDIKFNTSPYIVQCNRIDDALAKAYAQKALSNPYDYPYLPVGERIGNFNLQRLDFNANQTYILTSEFDCRKTDILDNYSRTLPKIHSDTYIGCIIDYEDDIEESNESNNSLVIFKFNCNENQANEDEEL